MRVRSAVLLVCIAAACATPDTSRPEEPLPGLPPVADDAPEQSLRAAPPWARAFGFAPQSSIAARLFDRAAARPVTAGAQGGVLTCKVHTTARADLLGANDLRVELTVGPHPPLVAIGPEESSDMLVTVPLVKLEQNGGLRVEIFDRDVFGLEAIGTLRGFTEGAGAKLIGSGARVDCRWLDQRELVSVVARRLVDFDVELKLLPAPMPDPTRPDWGLSVHHLKAREPLQEAAALAGWADPRLQPALAALGADRTKFLAAAGTWAEAKAAATATGNVALIEQVLTAQAVSVVCGAEAQRRFGQLEPSGHPGAVAHGGCVVGVELHNLGERIDLSEWRSGESVSVEKVGLPALVVPGAVQGAPVLLRIDRKVDRYGWTGSVGTQLQRDERATFWLTADWGDDEPPAGQPTLLLFPVRSRLVAVKLPF